MKLEEILDTSILLGYHLLCSGADISRVEQSIVYICEAYEVKEINAFAIPSSIVVTISDGSLSMTRTKRVLRRQNNLDRVEKLSGLSRYICTARPSYEVVTARLEEVLASPKWGAKWHYGAHMLAGASFCIFFGGSLTDSLVAAGIASLLMFLSRFFEKINANSFFINIISSFCAAFISGLASLFSKGAVNADAVTIGTIMLLVPGIALANSMRDFITSDTMTGLSRMTEALFVAIAVALGVAFAMFLL